MKNDKKNPMLAMLLVVPLLICTVLGCGYLLLYVGFHEDEIVLVDTCVEIDLSKIPEEPTERDWYDLAVEILKDNGWDLPTNMTGISYNAFSSCEPPSTIYASGVGFASAYFDGIIPRSKYADVDFNWITGTASVVIRSKPFVWVEKSEGIDISRMTVDCYEAFKMADDFAGREFRSRVGNACEINMSLANNRWSFRYRENGKQWENWGIKINVFNGKLERPELP